MTFTTVTRQKAKLRMALTGVSGAGKTLSALYIAYGITGDWGKIALIDTEHERGRFYADRSDLHTGAYLYASMTPPYSPNRYKQLVAEGAKAVGADGVVIVDSFSHAWNNEGGVLDIKEKYASMPGKNSYTAWSEAGREQNSLVNAILSVPCHTIVTMRSKMDYALQEDERGKMTPVKMGLAPIQRDDTEYEFDIVMDIARNHVATVSKDTTFLDNFSGIITPELGKQIHDWLDNGVEPPPKPVCECCGKELKPVKLKSGEIITPEDMAEKSREKFGQLMCIACYTAAAKVQKNETVRDDASTSRAETGEKADE